MLKDVVNRIKSEIDGEKKNRLFMNSII